MNRQIKFRGKCRDFGAWVYGDLEYNVKADLARIHTYDKDGNYDRDYIVDSNTVGQFTGLYDSNGTGIYEGDIVWHNIHKHYYKCKWKEDFACFAFDEEGYGETLYFPKCDAYKLTIKGNVHDNPDLLKEE